jgi:ferredoxin-thioredoxin reductase catalytic subunit
MSESLVLEWHRVLSKFAESKDLRLSDNWEKIVNAIIRNSGNCPCRSAMVRCPCPFVLDDIALKGHCCCNLFIKKS